MCNRICQIQTTPTQVVDQCVDLFGHFGLADVEEFGLEGDRYAREELIDVVVKTVHH